MAQASGSNSRITFDEESTFKADPGSPDFTVLPFKSESLRLTRAIHSSEAITSSRNPISPGRGNYEIGGAIELELMPYMGTILKHAIGTVVTTGAGPYVHEIIVSSLPTSLCIEKGFTDLAVPQYFKYNGCRINKMSMSFSPAGIIGCSIDVMGSKETASGTSIDATPTVKTNNKPFDNFEASIEEGGSSIAIVQEVSFDIENNLDGSVFVIGGAGERRAIPEGKVKVSGTLKALFESMDIYTKAINFTESSLKVILTRGAGTGAAANEKLEIFVPELVYSQNAPVITGPQGIFVELPFEAYYDNVSYQGNTSSIHMTLYNTDATI